MDPTLFIICGQIGVGKTTTARLLSKILNIQAISVDQTINRIFPHSSNAGKDLPFNEEEIAVCYNTFALVAEYLLTSDVSLIVDGVFANARERDLLISTAKKAKASYQILEVCCSDELIKERSSRRFSQGQGVGWEAHKKFRASYTPLELDHATVDTSKDIDTQLKEFIKHL